MRRGIELQQSEKGDPVVRVPGDVAWDLVEYLSNQRIHAVYSFEESRVVVRLDHITMSTAADLLDVWMRSEQRDEELNPRASRSPAHA